MEFELNKNNTGLLVIDMQNGFCHLEGSMTKLGKDTSMCIEAINPCVKLVDAARKSNVAVIFTRIVYRFDYADRGVMHHAIQPALKEHKACVQRAWDADLVEQFVPRENE